MHFQKLWLQNTRMHLFSELFSNSGQNFETRNAQQCSKHDSLLFARKLVQLNFTPIYCTQNTFC